MANILYVDPWELSEEQAQERYNKLARRLNDRMRDMEKRGVTTEAVEDYQALVKDMAEGNQRLPSRVSLEDARTALNRVQDILEDPGSKWRTTKEFAQRGMKTFNKEWGVKFPNVKDYINFWRSDNIQKLKRNYGSDAALVAAQMQTSDDDVLKQAAKDFLDEEVDDSELLSALGFGSQEDILRAAAEMRRSHAARGY